MKLLRWFRLLDNVLSERATMYASWTAALLPESRSRSRAAPLRPLLHPRSKTFVRVPISTPPRCASA
ncbi:MAG: hypothetical protein AVDCRST_MAG68-2202 [uncultured Gemmatimonadetes bacterium]|uniref:Uncharacterized protein n=1 Tax=uncultured Gemmatimonadota bacterium TaxID=203437 RepID=A0A6J4L810_9BACT|nr:MAG: hypothetical protein AVDCRST_MAG68-2202 [uncultured Gemmatimonadota bacterium]